MSTIAVIPARDEAAPLSVTLGALGSIPEISTVIVVDDGSTDATPRIARELGAEVMQSAAPGKGRGKGRAMHVGLSRVREVAPDAVLLADADLGTSASHLSALLDGLERECPVTIAAFPTPKGSSRGGFGLVKGFARHEIRRRTGYAPREPLSGQRALLVPALEALPGIAPGFGAEVGMTLDLLAAGIRPVELDLPLAHRPTGRNFGGFAHRARQGLDILFALQGSRIPW